MGISDEFKLYDAELRNRQWAVSALTDTELVVSLWRHLIKSLPDGSWLYQDCLSRWSGHGNKLFAEHLRLAIEENRPVRLVIASTDNVALIDAGGDGSKANKTFKARPERVGSIVNFDGDKFEILFAKPTAPSA